MSSLGSNHALDVAGPDARAHVHFPGSLLGAADRVGLGRPLRRLSAFCEPACALPSDTPEVRELLENDGFLRSLDSLATTLGQESHEVRAQAAGYLREMASRHDERLGKGWTKFSNWLTRAHDFLIDEEVVHRLRALDRSHALLFLFSHRSYLDMALQTALVERGISPAYTLGGSNLNFFPFGTVASRTGVVFIRRSTGSLPVYRLSLRAYIAQLVENKRNLSWSIEGGRTRTGKLRPPAYGILRYVLDAVEDSAGPEPLIVPVSIVYEQLHEVGLMTSEARGGSKRPEDLRWLVGFAGSQRHRLGRAYLDFGEPIAIRERLRELRAEDPAGPHVVERIALETCHRINRATPVTVTAVVCMALLGAGRALSLDEVLETVEPLARYIARRGWPVAGSANLTDRATIRRTLRELVASGVLTSFEGGTEPVWDVAPDRHLVAAFYRNTAVHILVDRAIGEVALVAATEGGDSGAAASGQAAMRLRELLKFDFFFPTRREFAQEMQAELAVVDPDAAATTSDFGPEQALTWLRKARPLVAHLVLRPYLDAYLVVADRLADWEAEDFDEEKFLAECLRVGTQWVLQRRLASEESLSLELFRPALRLARHRQLVGSGGAEMTQRRFELVEEIREAVRRVEFVCDIARERSPS